VDSATNYSLGRFSDTGPIADGSERSCEKNKTHKGRKRIRRLDDQTDDEAKKT